MYPNDTWKELNKPVGYVRKYAIDCLNGTLVNHLGITPPKSSTTIDPSPQAEDDHPLYSEATVIGLMKAAYYDGYTDRESECREKIARLNHQHANDEAANRMLSDACAAQEARIKTLELELRRR